MITLALESAAAVASAALVRDGTTLAELTLNNGNTHSETLLPMVDALLSLTGYTPADLGLFAASVGPGSFTGVRIGVATVKGLAFGSGRCCLGVSSVEALAYNLSGEDGLICPVLNARRRQVYTALFRAQDGHITRLCPDCILAADGLDALLAPYEEPVRFVGDAYGLAVGAVTHPALPVAERLRFPSAGSVARAALAAYEAGKRGTDATLTPDYLRPCQAERDRLAGTNQQKTRISP